MCAFSLCGMQQGLCCSSVCLCSLCSIKAIMLVNPVCFVTSFNASLLQSPPLPAVLQGLFGTKQVHKQDSLVSINRQHDLYTAPLSSWLSATNQASLCKSHLRCSMRTSHVIASQSHSVFQLGKVTITTNRPGTLVTQQVRGWLQPCFGSYSW